MHKTYRKTAALTHLSCESSAVLGGHSGAVRDALGAYGRHLGLAYQLVDDMLDVTSSSSTLGKPAGADMAEGHATAPALFALETFPEEMEQLIKRKFKSEGDVPRALELVLEADGPRRTHELATNHARQAADALGVLAPSAARDALLRLLCDVLNRKA